MTPSRPWFLTFTIITECSKRPVLATVLEEMEDSLETTFDALRAWVENGTVPDTLPVSFTDKNGTLNSRFLCPYPKKVRYNGQGNTALETSYTCGV